jgi:hypothetical protein
VKNINIDLIEIELDGIYWINPADNRDQWWALVNTVMTFGFHKIL